MFNLIRALCVFFLFALLTACAANGNSERAKDAPVLVVLAGAMLLALDERKGNNDGGNNSAATPTPMTTAAPMPLDFDSPEIGAFHVDFNGGEGTYFIVLSVATEGETLAVFPSNPNPIVQRGSVSALRRTSSALQLNLPSLHANGQIVPLVSMGMNVRLSLFSSVVAFQTMPSITALVQLCPVSWLAAYIDANFGSFRCPAASGLSYSPDIGRVVYAAMSDGFRRGVIVGESAFSFSGRYDGENRAAGFTYDFGNFKLRTDYIRLPSKQDGEVWLDTYRLGIIRPLNDETQIFAGMDSYDNAIMAIDINTKSKKQHRLGAAMAKGNKEYAIKYELRLNL